MRGGDDGDEHRDPRGDDGHEPPAAEERQVGRQLDPVVLLEQQRGDQADHDAAEHAVVDELLDLPLPRLLQDVRREGVGDSREDEVADDGREAGRPVGLAGEADRDADGEQQGQVGEQRVAGGGQDGGDRQEPLGVGAEALVAEHVGLTQTQQQRSGGQRGDGEHERAADALQLGEARDAPLSGGGGGVGGDGGHGALLWMAPWVSSSHGGMSGLDQLRADWSRPHDVSRVTSRRPPAPYRRRGGRTWTSRSRARRTST